jgi:pteridine reductase
MTNKVALITGGARRIGKEIARYLHEKGMNIVVHYRSSAAEAEILVKELNFRRDNSAVALAADLNQTHFCEKLIEESSQKWGRLDALINNASRFFPTPVTAVNDDHWDDLMKSNLKAPYFLASYAAPLLRIQRGNIVNVADIHGVAPLKNYSVYSISKAALIMLTKTLAKELAPEIRVNTVAPGAIIWPEHENELTQVKKENILAKTLLQRQGNPEDIAKAVWFFIQDANYVTGQYLAIDGGRLI